MKNAITRKIKVLQIVLSLEIGGMEQVVADLALHLDRDQFETAVACVESRGPIADELERQGIPVTLLPPMVRVLSFIYPAELIHIIRKYKADVVHIHSGCWHKGALAARLAGVRNIIYSEHGRTFPDSRKVMLLDRLYSPLTKYVVAVSENLADYMAKEVGIPTRKILVIINGINIERFSDAAREEDCGPIRIGIIARLAPVKDIATLMRAMVEVLRCHPEVVLAIIGDGPERMALEALVVELGIGTSVEFHGFRRDIPAVLREIDVFTLSSLSEGTSITLLEAMAAGKPVVVTNVGGNPAIVKDGENGFLVPPANPAKMAEALVALIENSELRQQMKTANMSLVAQHYGVRTMTEQYQLLYREGA